MSSRFKSQFEIDKSDHRVKVREGDLSDARLNLLIDFGMPDDEDRVSIQWAGQYFDDAFKGYAVELFGVRADELTPEPREWLSEIGAITPHHVKLVITDAKPGHFTVERHDAFHVWHVRVNGPSEQTISEELWHPKNGWVQMARDVPYTLSEDARSLLQFIEAEKSESKEESSIQIIVVSRENDESTEQKAAKQKRKPRIPRTPEETFLSEGLACAEALARKGKAHLRIYELAAEMGRDREAVSNAANYYKDAWAAINTKFTETREWLGIHKKR
ncbi:MAG TPA: hypothetical protein VF131_24320 [Blastocatellia bacterium]|nr:hypothetical protein [Blastocatellia bacterium]